VSRPPRDEPVVADAELLDLIARGYPAGLAALYDRHAGAVYAHALRIVGDGPRAEAAVEETFLRIWRQPVADHAIRGNVRRWIIGMVHRRSVEMLRGGTISAVRAPMRQVDEFRVEDQLATA
jgi:DNA-directed RNA polymerase specialized sigma24 family protein